MSNALNRRRMYYHVYIQWLAHHNILNTWLDTVITATMQSWSYDMDRDFDRIASPYTDRGWKTSKLYNFMVIRVPFGSSVSTPNSRFTGESWRSVSDAFVEEVLDEKKLSSIPISRINKALGETDRDREGAE